MIAIHKGELDEAEHEFKLAFQIYSNSGRAVGTIYATDGLAHVAWNRGLLDEAHGRYQDAIRAARKIPEMKRVALALRADAHVLHDRGDEEEARRELAESLALREAQKEILAAAETRLSAITFDLDNGQTKTTDAQFQDLLTLFESKKDGVDAVDTELAWAASLLQQRRQVEADQHFAAAELLMRRLHDAELIDRFNLVKAKLAFSRGELVRAELLLSQCLKNARKRHDLPAEINLHLELAQMKTVQGRASDPMIRLFASDARRHGFLRAANRLDALRGHRVPSRASN